MTDKKPRNRRSPAERLATLDAQIVRAEDRVLDLKGKRANLESRIRMKAEKARQEADDTLASL